MKTYRLTYEVKAESPELALREVDFASVVILDVESSVEYEIDSNGNAYVKE